MLKKNLFYTLILSVSQFVFPLVTFPYSLRILGPRGIGSVNFIDSITQYLLLVAALGIPTYGVREIAKARADRDKLSKLFAELLVLHLVSTLICALIYLATAAILPNIRIHLPLVLTGISLMFFSVFVVEWFYSGIENFSYITWRATIVRTLSVIALFLLLKRGSGPLTYYLIIAGTAGFTAFLNMFNLRHHISLKMSDLELRKHLKPLITLFSAALAVSVYVLMDSIILGFVKGEIAVGIYTTAIKIVKIPFGILMAINAVIIPQVSLAYQEQRTEDIKALIDRSFVLICVIGLPICAGIFVSADFLISAFAGNKFTAAVPLLRLLSPLTFIVGLVFISASQLLMPMGKERLLVRASVMGMCLSLLMNLIMIPLYSYTGAAITNITTEIFIACCCFHFVRQYIEIRFDKRVFLSCALAALAFIPLAMLIRSLRFNPRYSDFVIIVTCAAGYAAYLWFFVKNEYVVDMKRKILLKIGMLIQPSHN